MYVSNEKAFDEMLELYAIVKDETKTVQDVVDFVERVCVGLEIPTDPEIYDEQAFYFKQAINELVECDGSEEVNEAYQDTFIKGMVFEFVHDLHEFLEVE